MINIKDERFKIINLAIHKYGEQQQITQAIQELSELIVELTKFGTKRFEQHKLVEEMADAFIMLAQIMVIREILEEDIDPVIEYKLQRLNRRMRGIED